LIGIVSNQSGLLTWSVGDNTHLFFSSYSIKLIRLLTRQGKTYRTESTNRFRCCFFRQCRITSAFQFSILNRSLVFFVIYSHECFILLTFVRQFVLFVFSSSFHLRRRKDREQEKRSSWARSSSSSLRILALVESLPVIVIITTCILFYLSSTFLHVTSCQFYLSCVHMYRLARIISISVR
jgi:nicotinamide riboside transporter PnuC